MEESVAGWAQREQVSLFVPTTFCHLYHVVQINREDGPACRHCAPIACFSQHSHHNIVGNLFAFAHLVDLCRRTKKFSSGGGCKDFIPRNAVMPAPSAATAGSALKRYTSGIPAQPPVTPTGANLTATPSPPLGFWTKKILT